MPPASAACPAVPGLPEPPRIQRRRRPHPGVPGRAQLRRGETGLLQLPRRQRHRLRSGHGRHGGGTLRLPLRRALPAPRRRRCGPGASRPSPAVPRNAGDGAGRRNRDRPLPPGPAGPGGTDRTPAGAVGLDISKFALRRAARLNPDAINLVGDVWQPLPVADDAVDAVTVVFAPAQRGGIRPGAPPRRPAGGGHAPAGPPGGGGRARPACSGSKPAKDERLAASLAGHFGRSPPRPRRPAAAVTPGTSPGWRSWARPGTTWTAPRWRSLARRAPAADRRVGPVPDHRFRTAR